MRETRFHIVYTDSNWQSYDSISLFPKSDDSVLFYVREEVNRKFTYGRHSNYIIIDRTGTPSEYIFNKSNHLKSFATSGKAEEYVLTLEIRDATDNIHSVCLVADARFNLPDSAMYHYSEWNHEHIFSSILSYFREVEKYGENGYKVIQNLKKDCWEKDNCIRKLKYYNDQLTEQLHSTKDKIKDTIQVLKQITK